MRHPTRGSDLQDAARRVESRTVARRADRVAASDSELAPEARLQKSARRKACHSTVVVSRQAVGHGAVETSPGGPPRLRSRNAVRRVHQVEAQAELVPRDVLHAAEEHVQRGAGAAQGDAEPAHQRAEQKFPFDVNLSLSLSFALVCVVIQPRAATLAPFTRRTLVAAIKPGYQTVSRTAIRRRGPAAGRPGR